MMKSVNSLYEFLINYEYQQKISEVTTDLYQKALKMVKGGEHPPEQIQESEKQAAQDESSAPATTEPAKKQD